MGKMGEEKFMALRHLTKFTNMLEFMMPKIEINESWIGLCRIASDGCPNLDAKFE